MEAAEVSSRIHITRVRSRHASHQMTGQARAHTYIIFGRYFNVNVENAKVRYFLTRLSPKVLIVYRGSCGQMMPQQRRRLTVVKAETRETFQSHKWAMPQRARPVQRWNWHRAVVGRFIQ